VNMQEVIMTNITEQTAFDYAERNKMKKNECVMGHRDKYGRTIKF